MSDLATTRSNPAADLRPQGGVERDRDRRDPSGRDLDRSRAQAVDLLRVEGRGRGQEPEETDQRWEKGDSEESEDEIHGAHS